MSFANNLKNLRTSKNLGQQQLAEILQTTKKTISHWETGYCEPSISQLIVLSDLFEVSVDELIDHTQ